MPQGAAILETVSGGGIGKMTEDQKNKWMGLGIALAIVYAVQRYAPNQAVKAAALGVGGVVVAKQLPFVKNALA